MDKKISKEILIFPYINTEKIIKMDDFEIYPLDKFDLNEELSDEEISVFFQFTDSFRKSLFREGESPERAEGIGILKYKGTILRTNENSSDISDKVKIIFLLLKLHISIDFLNQWMSILDIKSFEYFGFNLSNNYTNKFGNMGECQTVHSTVPENIKGVKNINFLPIEYTINNIPVSFYITKNTDEIFGTNKTMIDLSSLYNSIDKEEKYLKKIFKIANVYSLLEGEKYLSSYYSFIPTIIEILLSDIKGNKKENAIDYGMKLDKILIKDNDEIEQIVYRKNKPIFEELGLIARCFFNIYDIRNSFLHQGKMLNEKTIIIFNGYKINLYDIFQLIIKYKILNSFIENNIIDNNFVQLSIQGDVFTTGMIRIKAKSEYLCIDNELDKLLEKAKSDKELKLGLYKE